MNKSAISVVLLGLFAGPVYAVGPTTWTTTIDATTYNGSTGTITFNDWGYKGPTGVGANDFQVGTGFDSSRIGQIQKVVTTGPDRLTSDALQTVSGDMGGPTYTNVNMDSAVNFFQWGYTTIAGSTFNQMKIDKAGNYKVAKSDMNFAFYDTFQYGANPTDVYNTKVNFQPYAISDAKGWCGSVLTTNSNGLEKMAGQVTFDFAFDAFMPWGGSAMTQIVPGFVMRSYGDYSVNVTTGGGDIQSFGGSAVGNNTNPGSIVQGVGGTLDPAFQNKVSFLGAGVVPDGIWVNNEGTHAVVVAGVQGAAGDFGGQVRADGAVWHKNAFGGYAFLLRADANRTLEIIGSGSPTDPTNDYLTNRASWTDYAAPAAVPVPAAVWLLGSGLMGLVGVVRRKKAA